MSRQDREPRKLLTILLISIPSIVDSGNANADFNFRYDFTLGGSGGGYIFNLSTKRLASGQYLLSFYAGNDPSFFYTLKFEVK